MYAEPGRVQVISFKPLQQQVVIATAGDHLPPELQEGCLGAALAVWTTTPWTMPANAAVAVNEKLQYTLVQAEVSFSS